MNKNKQLFSAIGIILFIFIPFAYAQEVIVDQNEYFQLNLDASTIAKGYTVSAFDDNLKLSLVPGILDESTRVDAAMLNESIPMPWAPERLSPVYQFEFANKAAYDDHKPFYVQIGYKGGGGTYKQVLFFDKNYGKWRPLPTRDYPRDGFVRSRIHLPFARIAVFSFPDTLTAGKASWYGYKAGNFAASPDFPIGSRLRVHFPDNNPNNDRYVDVNINDFGPDRSLHPERAIDLEKNAFKVLAPLVEGTIDIEIEPLFIAPDAAGDVFGIPAMGMGQEPELPIPYYAVLDGETGELILGKNATSTVPLASLTKMVAVKVFLDTKPSLNQIVAYNKQDAEYNYEYCRPWESGKLSIEHGETLSIENLIYSSLVGSTNNTVESLVRVSGLARHEFIANMNESVRIWGASTTHFVEPTGLSPENVSSAFDYAIIAREVLKNQIIAEASTMPEYSFVTVSAKNPHRIRNTNQIIRRNTFDITGSKTGYLDEAGYCLMVRAKSKSGRSVIVVTLGAAERDMSFYETERLIRFGLKKID